LAAATGPSGTPASALAACYSPRRPTLIAPGFLEDRFWKDGVTDDELGNSVALSGDGSTVVAGAPDHTVGNEIMSATS